MDLNKVMIIGRATTTIDVKTIESTGTSVANFVVATNRKYTNKDGNTMEEAEYHRCVSYGKGAEVLGEYLHKGKRIYVEGRLRTRKWEDAQGVEKYSTEIIVDNFIFLDSKNSSDTHHNEISDDDVPF
jgi:single-strand DNA-binding protein